VAITVAALAPTLPTELAVLLFVGYGSITFNSYAKTTLQLAARPEMRGRVMALWALAWLGSTPIGGPIVGWIGQNVGARWSLVVGGAATLVCGILALPALAKIDRRTRPMSSLPEVRYNGRDPNDNREEPDEQPAVRHVPVVRHRSRGGRELLHRNL
jgi:MFS family permease